MIELRSDRCPSGARDMTLQEVLETAIARALAQGRIDRREGPGSIVRLHALRSTETPGGELRHGQGGAVHEHMVAELRRLVGRGVISAD